MQKCKRLCVCLLNEEHSPIVCRVPPPSRRNKMRDSAVLNFIRYVIAHLRQCVDVLRI